MYTLRTSKRRIWYKTTSIKKSDVIRKQNKIRKIKWEELKTLLVPGRFGKAGSVKSLISSTRCQAAVKGRKEKKRKKKKRKLQDESEVTKSKRTPESDGRTRRAPRKSDKRSHAWPQRAEASLSVWIRRLITWCPGVLMKQLSPRL